MKSVQTFDGLEDIRGTSVASFHREVRNATFGSTVKSIAYNYPSALAAQLAGMAPGTEWLVEAERSDSGPCSMRIVSLAPAS